MIALLWDGAVEAVVEELKELEDGSERLQPIREARRYLEKRTEMLRYKDFRKGGYPIGSGIVESANKLVVEVRLKGAGKHWAAKNVNPMLSLRCAHASRRWERRWPTIEAQMRRRHSRRPLPKPVPQAAPEAEPSTTAAARKRDGPS